MNTFKLPDLGEGLQDAEIVEWQVEEGEEVAVDQVMVVVETAKAIVELPSPVAGVIGKLCAEAGETVNVGQALVEFEGEGAQSVSVVGELADANETNHAVVSESFVVGAAGEHQKASDLSLDSRVRETRISPDLLAFATKLGVHAEVTELDLVSLDKAKISALYEDKCNQVANVDDATASSDHPIVPLRGTKKLMAQAMIKSHQQVPAVTLFDDAHIGCWRESEDITVRVVQAMIQACSAMPLLNAWFDEEAMSIQTFKDINVGIAVNSSEGLFVPVIREAQKLDGSIIRKLINKTRKDVEKRRIKPQKLMGATISLSNFGTLSGRYATPIIVPPQVAIVGIGKLREEPIVKDGEIAVEKVMPISLSFDHRAATGAEASTFLRAMINHLENDTST